MVQPPQLSGAPHISGGKAALPQILQGLHPRLAAAASAMLPALEQAAGRVGADFTALFHTARLESGFNPAAKARTSSATGLFQFIDSTWLGTLARHGARHDITPASRSEALALRNDPAVASLMAAEHMQENRQRLESALGRKVGSVDLYLAHFLGAGGAARFLSHMDAAPDTSGSELFPAAARANRSIFHRKDGSARSLADIHTLFANRLGAANATPAIAGPPPATTAPPSPAEWQTTPADPQQAAAVAARQAAYLLLAELGG